MDRVDVKFASGEDECAAWLYQPDGGGPAPLIVMAHGFSGTREQRLDASAARFCAAGIGALLFDYRGFGASSGEPRQWADIKRQQADYRAGLAYARGLDWVDLGRIALFGSSFSAGHVLALAASEPGIAAVVAQNPFTDGPATLMKFDPGSLAKATLAGLRDQLRAAVGRRPYYMPAVAAPGSVGMLTSADSVSGFAAIDPPNSNWENRVAARVALRGPFYRPGRSAAKVTEPILFCVCDNDLVTPAKTAAKYAARAAHAEVKHYPCGHFDIYIGEMFERAVKDQTEFLVRHLLG